MNEHGVSRTWFTETDIKDFKRGIKNNHKYNQEHGKLKKMNHSLVYFKDFVFRYRTAFQNANFFAGIFQGFCL